MDDARATYLAGREARARDVGYAEARARTLGTARLVVVLVALALIVARVWGPLGGVAWWGVALCLGVFVALVMMHSRIDEAAERARAALRFHERGLAHLDGAWRALRSDGARFAREDHPYTDDLDVFGPASLFQRIDATETRFGEARLAAWLSAACDPVDLEVVRARQVAVKELAAKLPFRERLSAEGGVEERPDPEPFLAWAEGAHAFAAAPSWRPVAWVLPAVFLAGVAASAILHVTALVWLAPMVAEIAVLAVTARAVAPIAGAVSSRQGAFARFGGMLAAIEGERFEAPLLRELQVRLRASGANATAEMARLERIRGFLDARNNEVWRFFVGPALLWDLHCVIALEAWRTRAGAHARVWLEAIGELEALASLAGFAFERPEHAFPEIVAEPRFEGLALGHPLIEPSKRRDNDVSLARGGTVLVVTGSNMSGKSTLLRAIGVNAVLAMAGGPTCAKKLAIGPVRVAASMRVRDSLAEGVSRFYAEVRKLKAVLERARASRVPAALFLLDEVLHGTNSRERIIGARAIVRELVRCGALGAVSTHDLALGEIEPDLAGSAVNVHFEEQVAGDTMTFDYVLRPGIVKSSNALRIMQMVGIDVVHAD
jgi:ABC-type multidrug transport system fused ATPase/permease subunit